MSLLLVNEITGSLLRFDVTRSLTFDRQADVVQHPVERGARVTDHTQALPVTVRVQVFQTDTPVEGSEGTTGNGVAVFAGQTFVGDDAAGLTRTFAAYAWLEEVIEEGHTVTLSHPRIGSLNRMALSRRPISYPDEGGAFFDLVLQQIVVASTQTVTVERAVITGHNTADDVGKQATEEVEDERASLLYRGLKAIGVDPGETLDSFSSLFEE